jgi:hypothetical protein
MSQLKEAVQRMVASMIKPATVYGIVKSFDEETWSVTIELNRGGEIDEVTVLSTIEVGDTGLFIEPKTNSIVLCGLVEGLIENLTILKFSDIVRMQLMASDIIEIQGDSEGGLVKSSKVHSEIKECKDSINDLKQILTAWTPVAQDGGAALKAQVASWAQPLVVAQKSDYENDKVKHGN